MRNLPAPFRHLIVLVVSALFGWIATDAIPALNGQTGWGALLAAVLAAALAYFTPLVQAYGVGSTSTRY
jgi:Na+/citrate or Na+/malate symporter